MGVDRAAAHVVVERRRHGGGRSALPLAAHSRRNPACQRLHPRATRRAALLQCGCSPACIRSCHPMQVDNGGLSALVTPPAGPPRRLLVCCDCNYGPFGHQLEGENSIWIVCELVRPQHASPGSNVTICSGACLPHAHVHVTCTCACACACTGGVSLGAGAPAGRVARK